MGESNYSIEDVRKYEWELCRENVKPVKHGRRVEAINKALSHVICNAENVANEKLEDVFKQADESDDPLVPCLEFCSWFEDTYPSGKHRLFYTLLWKIVHKYIQTERYENDLRTLKIWKYLAENSMGHGYEVYQYAHHNNCLIECAFFYILWARDLEDRGAIQNARETLHRGRRHGAVPLETLVEEEDQLEMREMRRQLDKAHVNEEEDSDEDETDNNENRQVFTRVSTLDGNTVPVIRIPSIVGEQGPRTIDAPKVQAKQTTFQVFEDNSKEQDNYLEAIYDIHNEVYSSHIERYALKDNNAIKLIPNTSQTKKSSQPSSSFTVWDDEKENIDPNEETEKKLTTNKTGKPKLAFKKEFLEIAMEELLADKYLTDLSVRRKLNFDED